MSLNSPSKHWVDMPEFKQEKKEPFKTLTIRFETEEDYLDFQDKIDQKLTNKTKSIWHPYKSHWGDTISLWEEHFVKKGD